MYKLFSVFCWEFHLRNFEGNSLPKARNKVMSCLKNIVCIWFEGSLIFTQRASWPISLKLAMFAFVSVPQHFFFNFSSSKQYCMETSGWFLVYFCYYLQTSRWFGSLSYAGKCPFHFPFHLLLWYFNTIVACRQGFSWHYHEIWI